MACVCMGMCVVFACTYICLSCMWTVVWRGVVWYGMVWCGVVWCGVVWCGVVWCGVVCARARVCACACGCARACACVCSLSSVLLTVVASVSFWTGTGAASGIKRASVLAHVKKTHCHRKRTHRVILLS